jgi:hypothetical protein
MRNSRWLRLLAFATESVNQAILLRKEYLVAENRILRAKLPERLPLLFPGAAKNETRQVAQLNVCSDLVACSSINSAPHE